MRRLTIAGVLAALLTGWIAWDFTDTEPRSLRDFDPHEVARLETAMWRAYYEHRPAALFGGLIRLLRRQYHLPLWQSGLGAYSAARAALVFQRGRARADYEKAFPDLERYYGLIRRLSDTPFDVRKTAGLELEWWIVHRQRAQHSKADLEGSLAALQAEIYGRPAARFGAHARARAEAMLLRDDRAAAGGVREEDWARIGELLDRSWVSLRTVLDE